MFLSLIFRGNKQLEELGRRMKVEHDSYEIIFNEISLRLDNENMGKNVRNEIVAQVGRNDVISEENNEKLESNTSFI